MNQHLQKILNFIEQSTHLSDEEKAALLKAAKDANKEIEITAFKLDRTEKVKKTTAILLEETIEELEQKRKAVEAQNNELEIESSLERVRTVAMSMSKADDLLSICETMYHELKKSGFDDLRNAMIDIHYDDKNYLLNYDYSDEAGKTVTRFAYKSHPIVDNLIHHAKQSKETFTEIVYAGKELEEWRIFRKQNGEADDARLDNTDALYYYFYSTGTGAVGISMFKTADEKQLNILKRFRNVFDLAYKRYVDITNAEAQAKEAKIETALERVRAVAMAMKQSDELITVCEVMFKELLSLGFSNIRNAQIAIENDARQSYIFYVYSDFEKIIAGESGYNSSSVTQRLYNELGKSGDGLYEREYNPQEMEEWRSWRSALSPFLDKREETVASLCWYIYAIGRGHIGISTFNAITKEQVEIVKRFKKVFELSYTRFDDLQKAEAQSRESQIETALERVRSVAMSMMKSDDLIKICEAVYKQLAVLGFNNIRAAQIYIRYDAEEKFINYDYSDAMGGDVVEVNYNSHANTRRIYDVIRNAGDDLVHNIIDKKQLDAWKSYLYDTLGQPPEKNLDAAHELHYYLYSFGTGAFGISAFNAISNDALQILKRFRNVFSLSYQRYSDIALAESQAREAQIEAALERVRSRTLAMQKSDELAETSAVLFKQLIGLGISPNRLYISILKNDEGDTEFWITDEDGTKVSMAYEDNLNNNASFKKMYDGWKQQKKSLVIDMHGEELQNYFQHLNSIHVPFKGGLEQKRRLQYIAYFSKGFIGMASPEEQPESTVQLLERFAYVFNLTFTRFNDLQVAEAHALQAEQDLIEIKSARQKAENALAELQVTQNQLIQKEKMASLGELTAGIAHEIQNPLNFVNNFSEINNELIEELKSHKSTLNIEEQIELLNDIFSNNEKINHHGKRADAIVKGMLQHSRKSEGKKEPTDINALCDEYLRLAYHGLRAKDKTFNADFKTDFDENIGKINVVPQDIGRVLLNLFNNAFYAVNEKSQQLSADGYQPIVSIQTKRINDTIEIKVSDNGNGISSNIIDKIFQPFFTSKPTGQGTGLGLSLAYDIVKAHTGELKVDTKENEGSAFIIKLYA